MYSATFLNKAIHFAGVDNEVAQTPHHRLYMVVRQNNLYRFVLVVLFSVLSFPSLISHVACYWCHRSE